MSISVNAIIVLWCNNLLNKHFSKTTEWSCLILMINCCTFLILQKKIEQDFFSFHDGFDPKVLIFQKNWRWRKILKNTDFNSESLNLINFKFHILKITFGLFSPVSAEGSLSLRFVTLNMIRYMFFHFLS